MLAEAYDYAAEQVIRVRGPARALAAGDLDAVEVDVAAYQPPPSNEELELAFETVWRDDRFGRLIAEEALVPYAPMPPVAAVDLEDGRTERVITVGLHDERGMTRHLVGVRARDRVVLADLPLLPQPAERACEPSPASFDCPFSGSAGQVWVSVFLGGTRIWRFQLVRPAASSGTNGSGAELRFVDYRGHRVLYRAHVPILNIEYFDEGLRAGCGPTYRDWQNGETCFEAPAGSDPVSGIRVCSAPARTIIESGTDAGNFRGVAIYVDGSDVVVVSELSAGWYRYISQWRLGADGTISPRFGFAATANTCTCLAHHHHVYWRLDLDVDGISPNRVEEFNDPPIVGGSNWHLKTFEIRRPCDPSRNRHWRISNPRTDASYLLTRAPPTATPAATASATSRSCATAARRSTTANRSPRTRTCPEHGSTASPSPPNPSSTKTSCSGTPPTSSTTKPMVTPAATTWARTSVPKIGPPKHPTDRSPGALMRLLPPACSGRPIPPGRSQL